jgi:hypothetical protein
MDVAGAFGTAADFDDLPFLNVPTHVIGYEMLLAVAAKKLDAFTTVLVFSHPGLREVGPLTSLFADTFGVLGGVTVASVIAVFAVFVAAEVSHRTCKRTRRLVGASTAPYPYIEYHTAYFLGSALFVGAFLWNTSLLL